MGPRRAGRSSSRLTPARTRPAWSSVTTGGGPAAWGRRSRPLSDTSARHSRYTGLVGHRSPRLSLLAVQCPKAEAVLPSGPDLSGLRYFGSSAGEVAGVPALISRTGYTGEDGFELFVDSKRAVEVWRAVLEAGRGAGVLPCGLGARDA